jgi:hypothetical protein
VARSLDNQSFSDAFRAGDIDPAHFDHRAHLRAAICALDRLPFLEACITMRDGLRLLAARAGKPGLYHETITVAFMALIADRLDGRTGSTTDVDALIERHPELLDRRLLERHYRKETLTADNARRRFRLPDVSHAFTNDGVLA